MKARQYKAFDRANIIRRIVSNAKPMWTIDKATKCHCVVIHHASISAYGRTKEEANIMLNITKQRA